MTLIHAQRFSPHNIQHMDLSYLWKIFERTVFDHKDAVTNMYVMTWCDTFYERGNRTVGVALPGRRTAGLGLASYVPHCLPSSPTTLHLHTSDTPSLSAGRLYLSIRGKRHRWGRGLSQPVFPPHVADHQPNIHIGYLRTYSTSETSIQDQSGKASSRLRRHILSAAAADIMTLLMISAHYGGK